MPARIFISYTTRDDLSKSVSETLYTRLNAAGFAAWRDVERLEYGEKWHDQLTEQLVGSHAGVVLLTEQALESEWVLKEATYLKVRADGSPDFKIIAVLLDGLKPEDLKTETCRFKALNLPADQLLRCPDDQVAEIVIGELEVVKQRWDSEKPEESLIGSIAEYLEKLSSRNLLRLAHELELELKDWFPDGKLKETLARELARLMSASKPGRVVEAMGEVIEHIDKEDAEKILKFLIPFQVYGEGAQQLAEIAGKSPPGAAAGLNAEDPRIGALYLCRASGSLGKWKRIKINGLADPEGDGADLVQQVRKAFKHKWGLLDDGELEDEFSNLSTPYFVIIPSAVDEEALRQLRSDMSTLCFLILSAGLDPDGSLCAETELLHFLSPALKEEEEGRILRGYDRARRDLKEHYEALNDLDDF